MYNVEIAKDLEKVHRNSLMRIAKRCGFTRIEFLTLGTWEIEDLILARLDQGILERKRFLARIKQLTKEMDMLRQTSIFDFLKIHHEEITNTEKP